MSSSGVCCGSLEEPKALMKMGLSAILIGHVNFLLGALVHGVVLRHVHLQKTVRVMEYAVSNVVALSTGLLGVVVGILAIILSKNKKSRGVTWSLFSFSLISAFMAAASFIGLLVSMVTAIINGEQSLLTHCHFPNTIDYSSITTECPFDPKRIYSTTLILWVPLIVTCIIQLVFCSRCAAACVSFLGLPCCPIKKRHASFTRSINIRRPVQETFHSINRESPRRTMESLPVYTESPGMNKKPIQVYVDPQRSNAKTPKRVTAPPRPYHPPPSPSKHLPRQHRSLHPSESRPLHQPYRSRSYREKSEIRAGTQPRTPEQHQLLNRGALERSSFWI